jgi:hypothetical protein
MTGRCINLAAFTRATTAFDIVTDLFLVALPIYIFGTMNFQKSGRWTVIGVFSVRIFTIIPSIMRMLNIKPAFGNEGSDFTWTCVPFEIWTAIALHCSIITASVPCVRPFLRSLESGLLDSSMRRHPRLQSIEDEADKNLALTTISGWSAGMKTENRQRGSRSNSQKITRLSILACNGEKGESEHKEDYDEDQEFARHLRPDWSENKTNIQSTRTFPQFSALPRIEGSAASGSTAKSSWSITVTKESTIVFEEGGRNIQEIRTSSHIGQAR